MTAMQHPGTYLTAQVVHPPLDDIDGLGMLHTPQSGFSKCATTRRWRLRYRRFWVTSQRRCCRGEELW